MGVAGAGQRQREAAVATDLLQHVVEETDPGCDLGAGLAIEIDADPDAGLAGDALDRGHARRIRDALRDRRPVVVVGTEPEAAHTEVARQLQIGLAVADHGAAREVQFARAQVVEHHADAGLARRRVLLLEVRVDVDRR